MIFCTAYPFVTAKTHSVLDSRFVRTKIGQGGAGTKSKVNTIVSVGLLKSWKYSTKSVQRGRLSQHLCVYKRIYYCIYIRYIYILSVYVYICCFLCVIYIICTLYMHMFYSIRIHHMYIIYYIYNVLYIINAIYYMYEYIWFWISCRFMLHGLIWSLCLSLVILDPWIFHNVGLLDVCVST